MIALGLGGNVGTEHEIIERFVRARQALTQHGDVRSAWLYRTAALGPVQPAYLNTAVTVQWDPAGPEALIASVLELERLLGRDRRGQPRWGPRTIDLDVLLWDDRALVTPELEVPHPRLADRRFVLRPLVDLLGADHVVAGVRLDVLEARVADQELAQIATVW